jgi:flagellar P-ring protein precursor FlgI
MNIALTSLAKKIGLTLVFVAVAGVPVRTARAARLKDIATVKGVRENILIGYGIVVGLKGTGDSSTDVTGQSLSRLFGKLGLDVQANTSIKSKNAAAVIITANLPPFARVGSSRKRTGLPRRRA